MTESNIAMLNERIAELENMVRIQEGQLKNLQKETLALEIAYNASEAAAAEWRTQAAFLRSCVLSGETLNETDEENFKKLVNGRAGGGYLADAARLDKLNRIIRHRETNELKVMILPLGSCPPEERDIRAIIDTADDERDGE